MMLINGYRLLSELKSDNSGFAKWGFAEKGGKEFFIKQFLSPVYPIDQSILSAEQINRKIDICNQFENKKKNFYEKLNQCVTGNIITIIDFFRHESKYYIVTEKVATKTLTVEEISKLSMEKKLVILKTILYNISILHEKGIVHADIKPNNILIKETVNEFYTAKLIDFDSAFLEKDTPVQTNTEGDLVYLSPEIYMSMLDEDNDKFKLTHKIDIFALGVMFHQYLTGRLPMVDKDEYNYVFEAVLDNSEISIDPSLDNNVRDIIKQMLRAEPEERPEAYRIFQMLSNGAKVEEKIDTTKSMLISTMRKPKTDTKKAETNSFLKPAEDFL